MSLKSAIRHKNRISTYIASLSVRGVELTGDSIAVERGSGNFYRNGAPTDRGRRTRHGQKRMPDLSRHRPQGGGGSGLAA